MDREGFLKYLQARDIPDQEIEQHVSIVEQFERFFQDAPTAERFDAFSDHLVEHGLNDYGNYLALARYGRFTGNDELYVAVVEVLDGSEALRNLYERLGQAVGEQARDAVFRDIALPPLGTPSTRKYQVTAAIMARLEAEVDPQTWGEILSSSLRDLQDEWFVEQRRTYAECGDIDAYLERKGRDFFAQLERIRDEGGLFFTQPITDEVIDFVRSHPEIGRGVREGNVIYEVKIPYMTQAYLDETDEQMKRYYYCHCPWVRESLRVGDVNISPAFCRCSAGFHKKPWEVILGRPLEAEVVESVLKGDRWCKFAIRLPDQETPEAGSAPV